MLSKCFGFAGMSSCGAFRHEICQTLTIGWCVQQSISMYSEDKSKRACISCIWWYLNTHNLLMELIDIRAVILLGDVQPYGIIRTYSLTSYPWKLFSVLHTWSPIQAHPFIRCKKRASLSVSWCVKDNWFLKAIARRSSLIVIFSQIV